MASTNSTAPEVDPSTISGPCLVGRHDRCRGIVRHLHEDAICACPVCVHEDKGGAA